MGGHGGEDMKSEPHGEGKTHVSTLAAAGGGLAEVKVPRQQEGFLREGI